jgi:quercetin dioxygenase-like cupin family protein
MRCAPFVAILIAASACQPRGQVLIGALRHGLDPYRASHPIDADAAVRVDRLLRTDGASIHVVQLAGSERPHRHVHHDLVVHVLEGRGVLALGTARIPMEAGDVIAVPRGVPHWFAPAAGTTATALVTFAPPLDAPDSVPIDVDSGESGR